MTIELAVAGSISGTVDFTHGGGARPGRRDIQVSFTTDGATLNVAAHAPGTAPGTGFVAVVPYIDTSRRVAGELHRAASACPTITRTCRWS